MPGRARAAVSAVFLVNGIVVASWAPLIPEIKARHGLGDAQLGLVLLAMAAGAVLSLPVAGWLVGHLIDFSQRAALNEQSHQLGQVERVSLGGGKQAIGICRGQSSPAEVCAE